MQVAENLDKGPFGRSLVDTPMDVFTFQLLKHKRKETFRRKKLPCSLSKQFSFTAFLCHFKPMPNEYRPTLSNELLECYR